MKAGLHASTHFYLACNYYGSVFSLQGLTLLLMIISSSFPTIFCHFFKILFLKCGGWNDNHLFRYNAAALCLIKGQPQKLKLFT